MSGQKKAQYLGGELGRKRKLWCQTSMQTRTNLVDSTDMIGLRSLWLSNLFCMIRGFALFVKTGIFISLICFLD